MQEFDSPCGPHRASLSSMRAVLSKLLTVAFSWLAIGCAAVPNRESASPASFSAVLKDGPVFVLLHGWASDTSVWALMLKSLPGAVVGVDAPGHGARPPNGEFSFAAQAEGARTVLKLLGGKKSVVLVAHSNGAYAAREYYRAHPEEVCAIVLLDGTLRRQFEDPETFRSAIKSMTKEGWAKLTQSMAAPAGASPETLRRLPIMLDEASFETAMQSSMALLDPALYGADQISAPVLLLYVSLETWTQEHLEFMRRLAPRLTAERIADVSHWLPWDAPADASARIARFLPPECRNPARD